MLLDMMRECRNFFELRANNFYQSKRYPHGVQTTEHYPVTEFEDDYTIDTGVLSTLDSSIITGQYIAIYGSILNDGIWKVGADGAITSDITGVTAQNETFTGTVYPLKVPPDFVLLAADITAWRTAMKESSPYSSESFLGYSYSKAQKQGGGNIGWQQQYADRLTPYRRMFKGLPL
jgi:hypothetical protein